MFHRNTEPEEYDTFSGPVYISSILESGNVAGAPELHYVVFEPGVKHWHGGSADTEFAHIAINTNPEQTGLQWFERITDEEYARLPAEDRE